MMIQKPSKAYGGTKLDISPALPRAVHNCPLANYITTPLSCFAKVESSFINVNKFMRLCSSIHGQDSLYIFTLKSFDPDTVPLKWDPVQLLHGHFVLYQDASYSGDAYSVYVVDHLPICKYLLP